jgi:hypothetical protein
LILIRIPSNDLSSNYSLGSLSFLMSKILWVVLSHIHTTCLFEIEACSTSRVRAKISYR